MFYNHYDVQPAEPFDLWDYPPFSGTQKGNKIFGRGATDDKGELITRIKAVEAYLKTIGDVPCNVKFVIEGEEETGSAHIENYLKKYKKKFSCDGVIWEFGYVDSKNRPIVGLGMKDPNVTFGETGVSPEQQAAALRDSLIAEFKRFLTQETGNGISNVDITNMERLMGKMDIFGNPNDALNRVDQVRGIFEAKAKALSPFIKDLTDPYYYASDAAFAKSQTALAESMGYGGSGKMGTQNDGRVVIDLTTGG